MTEQQLVANRAVVEAELRRMLRRNRNPANTVVLLHAAAQWYDAPEFGFETENGPVQVSVATCPTVLAVLAAISADREPDTYLVVLTPHESHDVGQSVLARAVEPTVWPINRWDLVREAFGVHSVDPRLLRSDRRWVSEALLDAQPVTGWRRLTGSVLTESAAMSQLACVRLGLDGDDIDAAALLEWSASTVAAARYEQIREAERTKLTEWLTATVGPVAAVVFRLAARGKVGDAIPFGLAAAALYGTSSPAVARGRAEERYFGGNGPGEQALNEFAEAAESLVARWTDNGHAAQAAGMCERAERILTELGGMAAAAESSVLDAGLNARLTTLGEALTQSLPAAEDALRKVREHRRRRNRDGEVQVAEAAVRVARWLATPAEEFPARLTDAATRMIRSWGWADRALAVIGRADTSRVPRLGAAYASLSADGTARRAELDQEFARRLVSWLRAPGVGTDLLLLEDLLERVARPVANKRVPVIVVLDGMDVAIGIELTDEFTAGGSWVEAGRRPDGREPALAKAASATSISQMAETTGFAAFWGRRKSRLFRKAGFASEPDQPLNVEFRDAIFDPDMVVGIVLNSATYLREIADEARRAGRPLIITANHGRVLDHDQPHAGATPAEVVVPVITLLPSTSLLPDGWTVYDPVGHAPSWWDSSAAAAPQPPPALAAKPSRKPKGYIPAGQPVLFDEAEAETVATLGVKVVTSVRMTDQRQFARRAPDNTRIAALIDGLDQAGGRLTIAEVAQITGEPAVRMTGYVAQVARLLNVDGYRVIGTADGGRTVVLDIRLLREQFLGG